VALTVTETRISLHFTCLWLFRIANLATRSDRTLPAQSSKNRCVCVCLSCVREGGKRNRWVLEVNLGFMDVRFDGGSRKEDCVPSSGF
jgi:hypothetical protein